MESYLSDLDSFSNKTAAALAAYALSAVEVPFLEALGFKGSTEAFRELGSIFGVKPNTIKNFRDSYDPHTGSHRAGWHQKGKIRPVYLNDVMGFAKSLSEDALIKAVIELKSRVWDINPMLESAAGNVFLDELSDITSDFQIRNFGPSLCISISNTGRSGQPKWFTVTVRQIVQSLTDLVDFNDSFKNAGENYDEKRWRTAFDEGLTSDEIRALSGTQTKAFFVLLSKLIQYVNGKDPIDESIIPLNKAELRKTIALLEGELLPVEALSHVSPSSSKPSQTAEASQQEINSPRNILFFGAPGTGKSHNAEHYVGCPAEHFYRTVFFADYQNADFVGTVKPAMDGDNVSYRFEAGPLVNALKDAYANPTTNVVLLIEEINRGNAPAIFGEMFQLLDRDKDGSSKYSITVSESLQKCLGEPSGELYSDPIRFPSNLFIVATMNAGDQGVFALDTAFKRRWHFRYMPIDFDTHLGKEGFSDLKIQLADKKYSWAVFAKTVNEVLVEEVQVPEDRLLGPFFLSPPELDAEDLTEAVADKVLPYLWEDVLRYDDRTLLFDSNISSFAQLQNGLKSGQQVFSDKFNSKLSDMVSRSGSPRETPDVQNEVNEEEETPRGANLNETSE